MTTTPAGATPATVAVASGAPSASDAPLALTGIEKRFGDHQVLRGVDLSVAAGQLLVVLGANGSGKSTLLRCAVRLTEPDAGQVRLMGQDLLGLAGADLRRQRRQAAVIFQNIALVRQLSAFDNVCCGALGSIPLRRSLVRSRFPAEVQERATVALERVGLLDKAWQRAGSLSGGQAQRVAIARAYCQQARVILADEPVSALDPRAAENVLGLLARLAHEDGLAVLAVLHQPDLALRHADRIVGMYGGRISFDAAPAALDPAAIEALYRDEEG